MRPDEVQWSFFYDVIRLRLFPFSLRYKAKSLLLAQPQGSIITWQDLLKKFLAKYFPLSKSAKLRSKITSFFHQDGESLYEAWERFKYLLRRCPNHGIPEWLQIQTFYNGMTHTTRVMIDTAARGSLNSKTPDEAMESMAGNYHWSTHDQNINRRGVLELDTLNAILVQNQALSQQVASITKQLGQVQVGAVSSPALICDFFGGGHANEACEATITHEQINYMGNAPRNQNNPYSNTYNSGRRNHPNFSLSNTQGANASSSSYGKHFQPLSFNQQHFPQQNKALPPPVEK